MEKIKNLIGKIKDVLKGKVDGVKKKKQTFTKKAINALVWVFAYALAILICVALVVGAVVCSVGIAGGILLVVACVSFWLAELLGLGTAWALAFFLGITLFLTVRK